MSKPSKRKVEAALRAVATQGQGVMQVTFVWREDAIDLVAQALLGHREAVTALSLVSNCLKMMNGTFCLLCEAVPTVNDIGVVAGLHAATDSPGNARTCGALGTSQDFRNERLRTTSSRR